MPPVQNDDDTNVELPSEDPLDNVGNISLADGKGKTNLFRLLCTCADGLRYLHLVHYRRYNYLIILASRFTRSRQSSPSIVAMSIRGKPRLA